MFGLITGFMEAGETPEEISMTTRSLKLDGVQYFQRMSPIIITNHSVAEGADVLSLESVAYKLHLPEQVKFGLLWHSLALADWLQGRGIEPIFMVLPAPQPFQTVPLE